MCAVSQQGHTIRAPEVKAWPVIKRPAETAILISRVNHSLHIGVEPYEIRLHVFPRGFDSPPFLCPFRLLDAADEVQKPAAINPIDNHMFVWPHPVDKDWGLEIRG